MNADPNSAGNHLPLRLLLVGESAADFYYLQDLLSRIGSGQVVLEHTPTHLEALLLLEHSTFDLLLCDYRSADGEALKLLHEVRKHGPCIPVAFLTDYMNGEAAPQAASSGARAPETEDLSSESSAMNAVRCAIDLFCKERQKNKAEEMVRKLWRTVEQTTDLVMISNSQGVMEYVNPAFEALTGFRREEAIGRTFRILKSRQQSPAVYEEMWRSVLAGNVFRGTVVNRKKNGETFVAEKVITPLRDAEGKITHFVSTDRDITERTHLEAQLQQAQKLDAIGRLAGGVAHDFNNLLMVISSYAELMQDALSPGHPLRHNVTEIMSAARRATDLTRQLLAFGRKQVQSLRVLDLNTVIQDISRMLPRLIGEDIHLVFAPGQGLGAVKADPVQIEQVVLNLAVNARDAMPQGGKLTIETANLHLDETYHHRHSIVPPGDYVVLSVSDAGEGIAQENLPHIFEPFYTTKAKGKGTGLGLATVYGIVKQSGGFIWVYSEVGLGTTFKIYLPRVRPETETPPLRQMERAQQGCGTLLLVEDESPVRRSEREFLQANGYTVLEAGDGEEALRVAREYSGEIQLVITDVVMPRMGGADLAKRLAAERPKMKVLFVSGYAEKTVLEHGAIDVTFCFLQKPFPLRSLTQKIWDILHAGTALAAASSG